MYSACVCLYVNIGAVTRVDTARQKDNLRNEIGTSKE